MAFARTYNYDRDTLRAWMIEQKQAFRDKGLTLDDLVAAFDEHVPKSVPVSGRFGKGVINRLTYGKDDNPDRVLKTLSERPQLVA